MTFLTSLLADFSLDLTGSDAREHDRALAAIPPGTRVHVGFIDSEDLRTPVAAARTIRLRGHVPVPIIAARRLRSAGMLREFLAGLRAADATGSVLVVAGDPARPEGPYPDAGSVIGSGMLEEYGVRQVSVAGHPGGHPAAAAGALWSALAAKAAALQLRGLDGSVVTQFTFDANQALGWLAEARARGIRLPVRVGVAGPADVRRLLAYASRLGVGVTSHAARDYGFSLTDPAGTAAPDRFIQALASGYDARRHGELAVNLHFFSFGGMTATADWISQFRDALPVP